MEFEYKRVKEKVESLQKEKDVRSWWEEKIINLKRIKGEGRERAAGVIRGGRGDIKVG